MNGFILYAQEECISEIERHNKTPVEDWEMEEVATVKDSLTAQIEVFRWCGTR